MDEERRQEHADWLQRILNREDSGSSLQFANQIQNTSFEEDRGDGQPPGEFEMSAYRTLLRVPSVTRIPLYEEERQEAAKQQGTVLHYAAKILDDARGKDDHKARGGEAIEFGYSQDAISNIFDTIQQENMPLESTVARASGR